MIAQMTSETCVWAQKEPILDRLAAVCSRWVGAIMWALLALLIASRIASAANDAAADAPLSGLSNEALWAMLIGFAVPWVVAIINRSHWASDAKFAVFFVFTAITTAVTVWVRGDLDTSDYFRTGLIILVSASATYMVAKTAIKTVEVRTT